MSKRKEEKNMKGTAGSKYIRWQSEKENNKQRKGLEEEVGGGEKWGTSGEMLGVPPSLYVRWWGTKHITQNVPYG